MTIKNGVKLLVTKILVFVVGLLIFAAIFSFLEFDRTISFEERVNNYLFTVDGTYEIGEQKLLLVPACATSYSLEDGKTIFSIDPVDCEMWE